MGSPEHLTARWGRWLIAAPALLGVGLAVAWLLAGRPTWAAMSSAAPNSANSLSTGDVRLSDDDAGVRMFEVSGLTPSSAPAERCIKLTYDGSLPASVALYATSTGTLPQYLNVKITRGALSSAAFPSCSSFTADSTDYVGRGAGVIYDGTLAALGDGWSTGVQDPRAAEPATWTTGEVHAYRVTVSVVNDPAARSLSTTAAFIWEARNL